MKRRRSSARHGSALIIVLAFVVMISIILLTYLATTQSSLKKSALSASIVETDLLGEAAVVALIDDLRQEMLAGADTVDTNNVMAVSQPWAMVPGRVLKSGVNRTDANFFTLVKQSVSQTNFYPGDNPATYTAKTGKAESVGRARASAVNTGEASINGRVLSTNRWNKPKLLTGDGFTAANQLPDWILITRRGPVTNGSTIPLTTLANKATGNENYVIGRFAYNIYDVSGLLDINVAGFPAGAATEAGKKGSLAWADLSAIPGVTDMSKIASWRNTNSAGSYRDMVEGRDLGVASMTTNRPWGEPGGFLKPYATNSVSDNKFFTRQDLIKYAESYAGAGMNTNALPYFTTFSADKNVPTFAPEAVRPRIQRTSAGGGNDAYGSANEDAINVNFATAKRQDGEIAVKRRFPLERLKYITPDPDTATAEKIEKYFGLRWDSGVWVYTDGNQIKRLSEISGREPNFIELLQAAVTVGSLGGQYQLVQDTTYSPRKVGGRDGAVGYHIIQLAANIIDQYDANSYPTRISFAGRTFSGIEDLPYLMAIRFTAYRHEVLSMGDLVGVSAPTNGSGTAYRCALMLQPTIWNPHAASAATYNGPTKFRVVADGEIYTEAKYYSPYKADWWTTNTTRYSYMGVPVSGNQRAYPSSNPKDRRPPESFTSSGAGVNYVSFETKPDVPASPANFRAPFTMSSKDYPTDSKADSDTTVTIVDDVFNRASGENTSRTIGFFGGYLWGGGVMGDPYFENADALTSGLDFALQYQDPSGNWISYDEMEGVPPMASIFQNNRNARRPRAWTRIDPRVDRFGYRNYLLNVATTWKQGETFRPGTADDTAGGQGDAQGTAAIYNWIATGGTDPWGLVSENTSAKAIRYSDADGVLRVAMGGSASGLVGLPLATGNLESRPVVLNRPFRSVAELGYVSRAMPWKQLDFWTPESGDAALLDVFSVYEPHLGTEDEPVAGKVNLNTRRAEVIQALLLGATKVDGVPISAGEARTIADSLVSWTTNSTIAGRGPLRSRSELLGKVVSSSAYAGFSSQIAAGFTDAKDKALAIRRQSVMRALGDVGTTRTWAFLIDLIVQKGRYPASADSLAKFSVEGEQRFWIHVAMDRYTGEITYKQVEAVNE